MSKDQSDVAVSLSAVSKSYGLVRAVDGLDLSIPRGKAIALLGPNGSGKSTTVSMLLGLIPADSGEIRVFGQTPRAAVRAGRVGAMLQEGSFPAGAKVGEVLKLARNLYPEPAPLDEVVEAADLGAVLDRPVNKLSGGQLQRVRFAFAYAGRPDLLVLDEPTVAMDVEARARFWKTIREFAESGRTVLFSTHYLEEADEAADEIIVLAKGKVLLEGTGEEIKKRVGRRTISFKLEGTADGLDRLPGVSEVDVRHGRAHLTTTDSDATVNALLTERGGVKELELAGGSLDAAFLALTGSASEGTN